MRKLMGLPLLNEDTGATAEDVKKKVLAEGVKKKILTEDRSFSLGFGNQGGLTIAETNGETGSTKTTGTTIHETTEAEETEEEGVGAPINDVVEEQDEFGYGPLGIETGIDVGNPQPGDGEGGLGLNTDAQVFAEGGSFAKYNITLQDKMDLLREQEENKNLDEQRKDKKKYNFDTIEIDVENKEDEKILKKFDNILNREGFNFTNTISGAEDDNYNHHHFYEFSDDIKDTIQVNLTQVDDGVMTGDWGYGDYYNITYSPGDTSWEESVTIDGAMNKDTIQDFKRDIKTVLKDNMDKSEGDWY